MTSIITHESYVLIHLDLKTTILTSLQGYSSMLGHGQSAETLATFREFVNLLPITLSVEGFSTAQTNCTKQRGGLFHGPTTRSDTTAS